MSYESTPSRRKVLHVTTATGVGVCGLALAACSPAAGGNDAETSPNPIPTGGTPVQVGKVSDVPVGATATGKANGVNVVIFRPDEKTVLAYSDICTHAGCQIKPQGADFECPCHGSVFKGSDGTVTQGPAKKSLTRFAAAIDGEWITVAV